VYKEPLLHAFSKQTENDIINMPLIEVQSGQLQIACVQHPDYDYSDCHRLLSSLPAELKNELLSKLGEK
jgi:hypothetical protein